MMHASPSARKPFFRAIVALGGNLGATPEDVTAKDVPARFASARSMLDARADTRVAASSLLYRSPPLGPADQPDYHNAVILLETRLPPETLLAAMQAIEQAHGRIRTGVRWGPRTLDLDLVAHHDAVMDGDRLTLPHPRMHERMFVLQPLCDIWPDWTHPRLGRTARELMQTLLAEGCPPLLHGRPW